MPGYYGDHCEKRPCDNVDCHLRGTCLNLPTSSTCKTTSFSGWNCVPGTDYKCDCEEGYYGLDCIFEIGEEIDVFTTTSTTTTLAFTLFPPTTTTTTTTTTTVSTTPEPKVAGALAWAAKNIVKVIIAIIAGFVVLSGAAHVLWMIGMRLWPFSIWCNYRCQPKLSKVVCPDHGFPSSSDEESAIRYREKSKRSIKNTERRIRDIARKRDSKNSRKKEQYDPRCYTRYHLSRSQMRKRGINYSDSDD